MGRTPHSRAALNKRYNLEQSNVTFSSSLDRRNDHRLLAGCSWTLSAVLVFFVCLVQLFAMASLLTGRSGFALAAPAASLVALTTGTWLMRRQGASWRAIALLLAIALALVLVSVALSAFFYDLSWDGEWYHQTGILHIARDWNPLTDPMRGFASHLELWERHYAKGPWYFAAAVYRTTGHIEWGKAYNWLLLAASFSAVFAACLQCGVRRLPAMGIAAAVALNPVVMSEVMTYLVDAAMIAALTVTAAALIVCLLRPSPAALLAGAAGTIVAINAKFTGLVFLCVWLAAAALWCALFRRAWLLRATTVALVTLFLAVCVWGWNPYVTNTWFCSQPFYPLLGSAQYPSLEQQGKEPNERWETPKNMVGRNRFVRFGYAIFGRPGNQPYVKGRNAQLMWPFTATLDDLYAYKYHETRVSGFGPFFSGCLLLSLALLAAVMTKRDEHRWLLLTMMATIAASLLISHQLWWPRYGPQLWLLPILPVAFALRYVTSRWRTGFAYALLGLLLVDAAVVASVRLDWETRASLRLGGELRTLRDSHLRYDVRTRYFPDSWSARLAEAGVPFQDVGQAKLPGSQILTSVVEGYPMPVEVKPSAPQPAPTHSGSGN
jgi:hypothetical protein